MIGEIDLFGVFLPPLLVWLGIGLLLSTAVRWASPGSACTAMSGTARSSTSPSSSS